MVLEDTEVGVETRPTKYVGSRQRKGDGDAFVTGRITYTHDITLPGAAHLVVVRSTEAHARILSIDLSAASGHPGVLLVIDGIRAAQLADPIPHNLDPAGLGGHHADARCLAVDKVVHVGEPVAAVVATTLADAVAAAALVEIEYDPLPALLSVDEAVAEGAPLIYESWGSNVMISGVAGDGDFDTAAQGAHVLTDEICVHRTTTAPMETRGYQASWDQRGEKLTWYGTAQNPHPLRWMLSQALRISESQIRVVAPQPGGAFGLKMQGHPEEVLVPLLARELGRPVKWVETRAECMLGSAKEQVHRFRVAHDDNGKILAFESEVLADHGSVSAGPGWGMAFVGSLAFPNGYDVPVCNVKYSVVMTNKAPWTGARPFGKDVTVLVMERVIELVAASTGIDSLEIRLRNWVRSEKFPIETATGLVLDSGDYGGLLEKILNHVDYDGLREEQRGLRAQGRYRGIGLGFEVLPEGADIPGALVGGADTATVRMAPSGDVTILTGVTSPGSGNDTGIAQIVADELGIAIDSIVVVQGDTATCPFGYGNLSSRSLVAGGGAAALAAHDVAQKLRMVAAAMLQVEVTDVQLNQGMAGSATEPEKMVPIAVVAHATYSLGYIVALAIEPTLESTRTYRPAHIRHLPDAQGHIQPFASFSNALHLTVVDVDPETGIVEVRRHVAVHDCGTVVNPMMVEGQLRGAIVMGLGAALNEELIIDGDGHPLCDGFKTYLLPRATDVPALELLHQCTPSPYTSLGAKGAGESGFAGAFASVTNAVNDALRPIGVRIHRTPLSPPRVLAACLEAQRSSS